MIWQFEMTKKGCCFTFGGSSPTKWACRTINVCPTHWISWPTALGSKHPSPFMTLSYRMADEWKKRTPEVVHVDGTSRPQVVSAATNPRYHRLISEFHKRTGLPVVINTSLNRRGEPMIESPKDALNMFFGSGLEHLIMENVYVRKNALGNGSPPS